MTVAPVSTTALARRFVTVGARQVHYRRAGSGPPLVLLHESPLSSRTYERLGAALAERFTVVAPDTPGYGLSERLALESPTLADYAAATGEALDALGLERCAVYGFHTGALIALELARREPERVAAAVLDGFPAYTEEERAEWLARYVPTFPPQWDGSHMAALWSRFRDQYMFWPWYRRQESARLDIDLPDARALHEGVMEMLRSGDAYRLGPIAAFSYRPLPALAELTVPTAIFQRDNELFDHRDRFPQLPGCVTQHDVPGEPAALAGHIAAFLQEHELPEESPPAPEAKQLAGRVTKDYVDTAFGQLLVRRMGAGERRPLLMLHASPGSARQLEPLLGVLAATRPVLAFDTIGNGDSDKPPFEDPLIGDYARVVLDALDRLGLDELDLYGTHTGAMIAAEVAILAPERVANVVLEGVTGLFRGGELEERLERYTPPFEPRWDGTHLLWAWNYMKNQTLFYPWYEMTRTGVRHVPVVDAEDLAVWVLELLKSGETYPLAYRAAFRYPSCERLPELRVRTLVCASGSDPLTRTVEEAASLVPGGRAQRLPDGRDAAGATIAAFLDGA